MRVVFGTLLALFALATGRLVLVNDQLIHERNLLLEKLATVVAHDCFDDEESHVFGNVSVETVEGAGYQVHGKLLRNGRYLDWRFAFRNYTDLPIVPVNIEMNH